MSNAGQNGSFAAAFTCLKLRVSKEDYMKVRGSSGVRGLQTVSQLRTCFWGHCQTW